LPDGMPGVVTKLSSGNDVKPATPKAHRSDTSPTIEENQVPRKGDYLTSTYPPKHDPIRSVTEEGDTSTTVQRPQRRLQRHRLRSHPSQHSPTSVTSPERHPRRPWLVSDRSCRRGERRLPRQNGCTSHVAL